MSVKSIHVSLVLLSYYWLEKLAPFCTLRGGKAMAGSNAPEAFLVCVCCDWPK